MLVHLNTTIYDNVRQRLDQNEHVTLMLARYWEDGRLIYAGAHEEAVVYRQAQAQCEVLPVSGTWIGLVPTIRAHTFDRSIRLDEGDLVVLYTDGVTESRNTQGEMFGLERLCALVQEHGRRDVRAICDRIIEAALAWGEEQHDDVSVLVIRHRG
jgi:serine phosphatase RsbU (regulator of sigma subunit)